MSVYQTSAWTRRHARLTGSPQSDPRSDMNASRLTNGFAATEIAARRFHERYGRLQPRDSLDRTPSSAELGQLTALLLH